MNDVDVDKRWVDAVDLQVEVQVSEVVEWVQVVVKIEPQLGSG